MTLSHLPPFYRPKPFKTISHLCATWLIQNYFSSMWTKLDKEAKHAFPHTNLWITLAIMKGSHPSLWFALIFCIMLFVWSPKMPFFSSLYIVHWVTSKAIAKDLMIVLCFCGVSLYSVLFLPQAPFFLFHIRPILCLFTVVLQMLKSAATLVVVPLGSS